MQRDSHKKPETYHLKHQEHNIMNPNSDWPLTKRDWFHCLVNLGSHPEYYLQADQLALEYLNQTVSEPTFTYSKQEFNQWLQEQYSQGLQAMRQGHWLDTGQLNHGKNVGRFSDKAVQKRLLQNAPNNLVDGAWLAHIMPCGGSTWVESILSQIWYDEVGCGNPEENHPNLYLMLLNSQGIKIPSIYSKAFSDDSRFLDTAFEQPVFQLAVGLYPRQFLPELLGMTLWFEWNSTPSACQFAKCLRSRGIDDTYYKVHQRIDNPDRGHGLLARQAVEIYLEQDIQQKGLDVQTHWMRIWKGYQVWDKLSVAFEQNLKEHLITLDGKS
jgi:Iron-containing redox enzyme